MVSQTPNPLSVFSHPVFGEIRIVDRDGKAWFVAKDVAQALGYQNPRQALITHCKGVQKLDTLKEGGHPQPIIPESDVYRLVMRSKLKEAETFQDWICEEVLPTIRRTGGYQTGLLNEKALAEMTVLCLEQQQARIAELEDKVAEDAPKVDFHDRVTGSDTVCQLGVACGLLDLPIGRNTLFKRLREQGVLISTGDRKNHPRQEYIDRGYFTVVEREYHDEVTEKTYLSFVTHVTQRGLDWLNRRFGAAEVC